MENEKLSIQERFEQLPEWGKLLLFILGSICGIVLVALALFLPPYLAITQKSILHLLWWAIPAGITVVIKAYIEQ